MALLVSPLHPFLLLSDLTHTDLAHYGSAQVLWVASWYVAKMESEMFSISLHALPGCVSGKEGNPIMSHA